MDRRNFSVTDHRKLLAMRPRELHNYLMRTHADPALALQLKAQILHARAQAKADRLRRYQHERLWRALVGPLQRELSNAKVGRAYRPDDPVRVAAFDAYIAVLDKLMRLFAGYRLEGPTPSEMAAAKRVPNHGAHWVDWIPESRKIPVQMLFERIPHTPHAKRKTPFLRVWPGKEAPKPSKTKQTEQSPNGVSDPINHEGDSDE